MVFWVKKRAYCLLKTTPSVYRRLLSQNKAKPKRAVAGHKPYAHTVLCLISFAAIVCAGSANADSGQKPAFLAKVIGAARPSGAGDLQKFFMTIYHAELWRDGKTPLFEENLGLCLSYHFAITSTQFASASIDIMRDQGSLAQGDASLAKELQEALPSVNAGDRICAVYRPHEALQIYFNDRLYGTLAQNYARAFLGIWLFPSTPEPALRAKLLK